MYPVKMKRKGNKKNYLEEDYFERKQKKGLGKKDKSSKRKLTIYDEFDDGDLDDYSSDYDEFDEDDDN
jgi:hypothetical protein